jgi:hypothetical protein
VPVYTYSKADLQGLLPLAARVESVNALVPASVPDGSDVSDEFVDVDEPNGARVGSRSQLWCQHSKQLRGAERAVACGRRLRAARRRVPGVARSYPQLDGAGGGVCIALTRAAVRH